MDPTVAGSLILALGGLGLVALGVVALKIARGPVLAEARLAGVERRLQDEADRLGRLVNESHEAAVEARRLATRRLTKAEKVKAKRADLADLAPDDDDDDEPAQDARPRVVGPDGMTYIAGETLQELAARRAREARAAG